MAGESAHQIWAEGLAALDAAVRALETKGRRAIAERIRTAREMSQWQSRACYWDLPRAPIS